MKKTLIIIIIIAITVLSGFFLNMNAQKNNEDRNIKDKINSEIDYLATCIIEISNKLNNIKYENYDLSEDIVKQEVNNNIKQEESETSSNKEESKEGNQEIKVYKMKINSLNNNEDIDWEQIQNKTEIVYKTWIQTVIDLYEENINNELILNFGRKIDDLESYIENKDKKTSVIICAELYEIIPKFIEQYDNQNERKINIENIKANILMGYSLIEDEKWDKIEEKIRNAENIFNNVLNDIANNKNQYNVNKAYIELKEFQKAIEAKNKEIAYIRYKNVIEEILNIK